MQATGVQGVMQTAAKLAKTWEASSSSTRMSVDSTRSADHMKTAVLAQVNEGMYFGTGSGCC